MVKLNYNLVKCFCSDFFIIADQGVVYACGDNKSGQCGIGTSTATVPIPTKVRKMAKCGKCRLIEQIISLQIKHQGAPIVKVVCGTEFSMILDCRGVLYSFGLPEYGQLGKLLLIKLSSPYIF
jgi:alpha-tubulin suppressor-like RCC1 family protein